MNIIYLLVGILLLSIALWIWRLTVTKLGNFEVRSSRQTSGKARLYLTLPKSSELTYKIGVGQRHILEIILETIIAILPFIIIGLILAVVFLLLYHFDLFWLINILTWITAIGTGIVMLIYLYNNAFIHASRRTFIELEPPYYEHTEYVGDAILPKRVYVGDSSNISVELRRIRRFLSGIEEMFSSKDKDGGKFITLLIREDAMLEVELQAAALVFDSEKKNQKQPVSSKEKLLYRWNCYFPNSGKQLVTLIFSVLRSSLDGIELGVIEHTVRVVQFAFLTQRQVKILASVIAIVGFIGTIIGIVLNIPSLFHLFGGH